MAEILLATLSDVEGVNEQALQDHIADTDNPHSVTAVQAGAAPASHLTDTGNPHEVTAAQAGAVENAGASPAISAAAVASRPAASAASAGHIFVATDENKLYRSNGVDTWTEIGGAASAVQSFNGRSGAVVPAAGDYDGKPLDLNGEELTDPTVVNYDEKLQEITHAGGALDIDVALGSVARVTLNGNVTSTAFSNLTPAAAHWKKVLVQFVQDGVGGRTVVLPAGAKGGSITVSTTADKETHIVFGALPSGQVYQYLASAEGI